MKLSIIGIDLTKVSAFKKADLGEDFVNNNLAYALICQSKEEVMQKGLKGKYIIGFVKNPKEKITPQGFKGNTAFRQFIFELASKVSDPKLKDMLEKSETKNVALVDQRIKDVKGKIPASEVIGLYKLKEDNSVYFEGNPNYALVSDLGLARFTPEIRKRLDSSADSNST